MNRVHTLYNTVANTHIVEHNGGIIVVDPGMLYQAGRILRAIKARGFDEHDVRLILITHGHIDHAGSAAALKRLTGAPIAMHRADLPLVTTPDLKIPPGRNATINRIGSVLRAFGWLAPMEPFVPDICPEDGDSLEHLGVNARVFHTPGHTDGSISVLFADGSLFVGDAILNLVHVAFPLWWHDPEAASTSACKIAALKPRVCYSGHGRAFDYPELLRFVAKSCDTPEHRDATGRLWS